MHLPRRLFKQRPFLLLCIVAATETECTVIRIRVFKVITFHHSISVTKICSQTLKVKVGVQVQVLSLGSSSDSS